MVGWLDEGAEKADCHLVEPEGGPVQVQLLQRRQVPEDYQRLPLDLVATSHGDVTEGAVPPAREGPEDRHLDLAPVLGSRPANI